MQITPLPPGLPASTATILGALVGAAAAITGGVLTAWLQLRLERGKWPRAREEALAQELRAAIRDLATQMAAALHSMCWLTWAAEVQPERVDRAQAERYDAELHSLLPQIMGSLTAVAALDPPAYERISPLADQLFQLDYQIGVACARLGDDRAAGIRDLVVLFSQTGTLERQLPKHIAGVVGERIEQRARAVASRS